MDKRSGPRPSATIVARKTGAANSLIEQLANEVQREMLSAWQAGGTVLAEQWLDRHPEVKAKPEMAVLVIYEELCLREERGEHVDSAELYGRFPEYKDALSVVLSCHRLMHAEPAVFPTAGEEFGEFRLLHELGRGGAGRVFLATQSLLSDRPLVVKLTTRTGDEHLSLARLQHTHIVPLFLVQEFPERNLRAVHAFSGRNELVVDLACARSVPHRGAERRADRSGVEKCRKRSWVFRDFHRPGNWISGAGVVRASRLLDWVMSGRRAVSRTPARLTAPGHQAFERSAGRRWSTNVARFPPCPRGRSGAVRTTGSRGRHGRLHVA